MLEYRPDVKPMPVEQKPDGLHIRAMFTHRLQDNSKWPNPIVLKLTNVKPALIPPRVDTSSATFTGGAARLTGTITDMGKSTSLEAGFQYRSIVGLDASDRSIPWQNGPSTTVTAAGPFTLTVSGLDPNGIYEYRAWAKHPLLTVYGPEKRLK